MLFWVLVLVFLPGTGQLMARPELPGTKSAIDRPEVQSSLGGYDSWHKFIVSLGDRIRELVPEPVVRKWAVIGFVSL
jgi:hypothetical protein